MPQTQPGNRKSIYMPDDLAARVEAHAELLDRSFSWVMSKAAEHYLNWRASVSDDQRTSA